LPGIPTGVSINQLYCNAHQMSKPMQMVDLKSQYHRIKDEINEAILHVIDQGQFIKGPEVKQLEEGLRNYLDVGQVIACANGTDALQVAMMALSLKPGDEVIVPVFTYIATAEVIGLLGLKPVMVDVEPDMFCIDASKIEEVITPNTKAIVPVHLFGQCANMDAVMKIAQKHGLFVIEDAAQAIGSRYTFEDGKTLSAGCIGDMGTTSFFPSKNLGCYGDGGAIFTNQNEWADRLRMICNHGQKVQYVHDVIGVNSRLDTLQAAILNVKLGELDRYESARNQAATWYDQLLSGLEWLDIPKRRENSTHVFHQYTIKVKDGREKRDAIRSELAKRGIPSMIYYPIPLHQQKAFNTGSYPTGTFPVSEHLCDCVLSLPIHTEMDLEMVKTIAHSLIEVYQDLQ
jgi:UDP-2-acetamido-2-deoxy-ribo-hexuluronate aminotransferase